LTRQDVFPHAHSGNTINKPSRLHSPGLNLHSQSRLNHQHHTMTMNLRPKVSSPSRPKFHPFPKLPTELKFKIWKLVDSSRSIHLKLQHQSGRLYWAVRASCPLNLLGVSREVRSEILKEYAQPFVKGVLIPLRTCKRERALENLHFNWAEDMIYVDIPERLEDIYIYWQRKFAINSTTVPWFYGNRKSAALVKSTKWETEGFKSVQELVIVVTKRSGSHSSSPVLPKNDTTGSAWKKRIERQFAAIKGRRPGWQAPTVTVMAKRRSPPKSIKKRKDGRKC
jgi:hypothetical protein